MVSKPGLVLGAPCGKMRELHPDNCAALRNMDAFRDLENPPLLDRGERAVSMEPMGDTDWIPGAHDKQLFRRSQAHLSNAHL
jgi:hypothetical protein